MVFAGGRRGVDINVYLGQGRALICPALSWSCGSGQRRTTDSTSIHNDKASREAAKVCPSATVL